MQKAVTDNRIFRATEFLCRLSVPRFIIAFVYVAAAVLFLISVPNAFQGMCSSLLWPVRHEVTELRNASA